MQRKAFKAFVLSACAVFAGCSTSAHNALPVQSGATAGAPGSQAQIRHVQDTVMQIPGDATNCKAPPAPAPKKKSALRSTASGVTAAPGSSVSALPGSSVSALPGSSVSALPGSSVSALPGSSVSALPGSSVSALPGSSVSALPGNAASLIAGLVSTCSAHGNAPVHVTALQGGTHTGQPACPGDPNPLAATAPCGTKIRTDIPAIAMAVGDASLIPGLHPDDIANAYNLPSTGGSGQTVAVVDAYDDPNAEADLAVYRQEFGMPACTTANGCFRKIGTGGDPTHLPQADTMGWSQEIALDLDAVSAVCASCNILLVEANSDQLQDLANGEDTAAKYGATVISNSFYTAEGNLKNDDIQHLPAHFRHPGIPIVVASGDQGGITFPASLPNVIAVAGTALNRETVDSRGWFETSWSKSGSGCSTINGQPTWQAGTHCSKRSAPDVAIVGDPDTGLSVFNSYSTTPGWYIMGGTSAGAPLVSAMIALAGHTTTYNDGSRLYANASSFFPVDGGTDGTCPGSACNPVLGYQAATGLGTPNGVSAF